MYRCPECNRILRCACPSCLLSERYNSPLFAYWDMPDEELPFARCTNCGFTWEMDVDELPLVDPVTLAAINSITPQPALN